MTDTDTPGLLAELWGKLDLTLNRLNGSIEKQIRRDNAEWAASAEQPVFTKIHGSVVVPASGFAVLTFDQETPSQGWVWHLRKLVVGGLTPTTVAAGRADLFSSPMDFGQVTSLGQVGIQDWEDQATSLPLVGIYGDGEVFLHAGEKLQVILSGATSGQQYVASGHILQFQEAALQQTWAQ